MAFVETDPQYHKFWQSVEFKKVFVQKNLEVTHQFVDFSKAFDSVMEKIRLSYGLPKETVAAIMMCFKYTKAKVCPRDRDTDYFDIVAGVQQGDTLAP